MRISDWSSDVCSSDLLVQRRTGARLPAAVAAHRPPVVPAGTGLRHRAALALAAGAVAAGKTPGSPGHDPRTGRTLRAVLRTHQPPGDAHAAGTRRPPRDRKCPVWGTSVPAPVDPRGC